MQPQQPDEAIRIDVPAWPKNHTPNPKAEVPKQLITEADLLASAQVTLPPNPPPSRLDGRVEVPQRKKLVKANHQHFPRLVTTYAIARLAQYVNSRHHSGWTGSRAEREHCKAWNLKPVPVHQ